MAANSKGLRTQLVARTQQNTRAAAIDLEKQLKASARRHRRTGQMEDSIKVTSKKAGNKRWTITATATAKQAVFTDRGTKPHIIRPRRAQALSWKPKGGKRVFAAVVHHPGSKGTRWWRDVMTAANLRATIRRTLKQ